MNQRLIGLTAMGGRSTSVLERIVDLERMGISAAWLTTGLAGPDAMTLFAAAAAQTTTIKLGTCIVPTWPRNPVVTVQQTQVIAQLADGRFRLGLGPSHKETMETLFGIHFSTPLTHLREYLTIVRTLLSTGRVDFTGHHYRIQASIPTPITNVPVMASALQPNSFQLCGANADGAITWICPYSYLRDIAIPNMKIGAESANRDLPPLIIHTPVCISDDSTEVRIAAREQLQGYLKYPFYVNMLTMAGYPESAEGVISDTMIDAMVLYGNENQVAARLNELFALGASEILAAPIIVGTNRSNSFWRTAKSLADINKSILRTQNGF